MRVMTRGALALVALLLPVAAVAGDLTLTWPAAEDERTVGYHVYVGTEPGVYDRTIDAGDTVRFTVDGLADEVVHYFAVKAYDETGEESPSYSPELVSLPSPRILAVEPATLAPGETAYVTVQGQNVDPSVQVRVLDPRLQLRSAVAGAGSVILLLEAAEAPEGVEPEALPLGADSFLLINPGRKAEAYFRTHPEAVDADGSGWVDEADLGQVRSALGTRRGDDGFRADADLDGDGHVSQADVALLTARVGTPARWYPAEDPATPDSGKTSESRSDGLD